MPLKHKEKNKQQNLSAILYNDILRCVIAFIAGLVMLIALFVINGVISSYSVKQIQNVYALGQYRSGSKNLTIAVESYIATGDEIYKKRYEEELLVNKNRDRAVELLTKNGLRQEQLEQLSNITDISNGLIPIEEQAFEYVEKGDPKAAKQLIFSDFYTESIDAVTEKTSALIEDILYALDEEKQIYRNAQKMIEFLLAGFLLILFICIVRTIRFARLKMLVPIVKVSEQLESIAQGDLHQPFDLEGEENEVGVMIQAIHDMKKQWTRMTKEIAGVLSEMSKGNYKVHLEKQYMGEFGIMRDSVNEIVDRGQSALKTVQEATHEINCGATMIAEAAEDLANGSTMQAAEISDMTMYMEEIRREISEDEKDAEETRKIAELSNSTLTVGKDRIETLEERVQGTIDYIQSFYLIAQEIENVAKESGISSLDTAAKKTYELLDKASQMIDGIIEVTAITNHDLEDVIVGAGEMTERIDRMVEHLKNGVTMTEAITDKMNEISGLVDNTSSTAQQTAAISEEQKGQIESLVSILDHYQV